MGKSPERVLHPPGFTRLNMPDSNDRREFLKLSALAGTSLLFPSCSSGAVRRYSANDKLNVGVIGVGGKGSSDTRGVAGENLVAFCDVDDERAAGTYERYPAVPRYRDYRVMLERENLDAVVISTPDHSHAPAAVMSMELGLHVYCQKPLTHTVEEARVLRELADRQGVATAMGNQGGAMDGFRTGVEVIRSGAIGAVREVHVWTNRPIWPQGMERSSEIEVIPETMRWDLWLGPAPHRPYNASYAPFNWRGFWDFGTGALGDMACHLWNLPYMALELGAPTSVVAESSGNTREAAPNSSIVRYQFPARGDLPPVELTWYDGDELPSLDLVPGVERLRAGGSILVGDRGVLYSGDDYGRRYQLLPADQFVDFQAPEPFLPRVRGENQGQKTYDEWIDDCKGGPRGLARFDYAGPLSEAILLGNAAIRSGEKIDWDVANLRAMNSTAGESFLRKSYRRGYHI